ncbi:hypothetical protein H072_5925 [Dactylellina haptotyla CBS 200.50]|uniref:Uncharacterized protein n=1 Tax=Dactylellina haptotyla (strain CBS 200.50) TaxID=1284197 RepID=S8ABH5_DACHA|nr:hypothetical protein H072_5925 [Dactylellina haptotyla CBS 200.50]
MEATTNSAGHPPHPPSSSLPSPSSSVENHLPIKKLLVAPIITTALQDKDTAVFATSPVSVTSNDLPFPKRHRNLTIDSDPSSANDMDGSSTAATSPPPSGVGNGTKLDENINPFPSSGSPVPPITPPTSQPQSTPVGNKRSTGNARVNSLNKPKSEHMAFFLNSLPPARSESPVAHLDVNPSQESLPPRQRSPGRVPAAVQALEQAQKRSSQSSLGSIYKSQESRLIDANGVTSAPKFFQPAESLPTEFDALNDISSVAAVVGSNAGEGHSNNGEGSRKASIRFSFLKKKRTNSAEHPGKHLSVDGRKTRSGSGGSGSTAESSLPISVLTSPAGFQPGRDPPMEDGKDSRNDATFRRDLLVDFENRRLEGRHEHPFEGSTALHHGSNIKSMGLKQLFRSISQSVKKSTNSFKKLVLRRAKTIPNQFSAAVHGHVSHLPPVPNPKLITRNERIAEYKAITRSPLPTFGPRVATPPPYQPLSRKPSIELIRSGATNVATTAAKGEGSSLTNGETSKTTAGFPNGTDHSVSPQASSPESSEAIEITVRARQNPSDAKQSSVADAIDDESHAVKRENKEGVATGFIKSAFTGW